MKKRALVIGINHYEDKANINLLKYAEQDASAMRYFLQRRCGFEVTPLMGRDATRRRISNATFDICRDLKGEDLFVFYFAGHGYEDGRGHLLLASDVMFRELKTGMAPDVVPVRGLEEMTAERGCSRLLILDACRSPLEKGREGMAMLNEKVARDIRRITEGSGANPPLAVLCSCSPKQRAHEVDELKAGAFTEALVTSLESRLNESRGFSLPGDLEVLTEATNGILKRYGIADRQDPWCTSNRGVLALIEKVACSNEESTGERAAGALGQFFGPSGGIVGNTEEIRKIEICALCGLRNDTADTFRCISCGKDYMCRDHFVKKERLSGFSIIDGSFFYVNDGNTI